MKNNMDEFDQEQFDEMDAQQAAEPKQGLAESLRNKPIFKLLLIMGGIGIAIALALGVFSSDKKPVVSAIAKPPSINEAPGGAASPFFNEQNEMANKERAGQALAKGGSSMITPSGHDVTALVDPNKKDPLVEIREETERLKKELRNEQQQSNQKLEAMKAQMAQQQQGGRQRGREEDDSLARAMQKQMTQMMEGWAPRGGKYITGEGAKEEERLEKEDAVDARASGASMYQQAAASQRAVASESEKILVASGTVNYAQLLMEANSDIPGPILVQILSGPLAGARALGRFEVRNDYLVMTFNLASLKGKEYSISALALDPDTTLGGMATEVDHRYLTRILLPAAGEFISEFGSALGETSTSTTISDGTVLQDQAKKGTKEALYAGLGKVGDTLSQFFQNEANNTKTLVRVAVGTPLGLFFLQPVMQSGKSGRQGDSSSAQYNSVLSPESDSRQGPYRMNDQGMSRSLQGAGYSPEQAQMLQNLMTMSPASSTTVRR